MPKQITKLSSMQIQEVSLVRRGANNKRFALTKSEESEMSFHELLKSVLETEAEGESTLVANLKAANANEEAIQCAIANYRLQNGFRDKLSKDAFAVVTKAAGYEIAKAKKMEEEDEEKKPFPGAAPPFKKKKTEKSHVPADMPPEMARVFKAQQDEYAALRKEHDELVVKTEQERKERVRKEYIAKCAKEYSFVPGMSAEEMGDMLEKAYEASEEFGQNLEKQWAQTHAAIRKSQLMVNQGIAMTNSGGGSAWSKIQSLAKELVQKSDVGLSEAKALDQVMKSHPELYQEYLDENPAQRAKAQ